MSTASDAAAAALAAQFGAPVRTLADLARAGLNTYDSVPAITTASLPGVIEGGAYSQTLATSGGLAPLTFAIVAGALPLGLTLHAGTGVIDGTAPVTPGTSSFTVQVTSASGFSSTKALSISVSMVPYIYIIGGNGDTGRLNVYRANAVTLNVAAPTWVAETDLPSEWSMQNSNGVDRSSIFQVNSQQGLLITSGRAHYGEAHSNLKYPIYLIAGARTEYANTSPTPANLIGNGTTGLGRVLIADGHANGFTVAANIFDPSLGSLLATAVVTGPHSGNFIQFDNSAAGITLGGAHAGDVLITNVSDAFDGNMYFYRFHDDGALVAPVGSWEISATYSSLGVGGKYFTPIPLLDGTTLLCQTGGGVYGYYLLSADMSTCVAEAGGPAAMGNPGWCYLPDGRIAITGNGVNHVYTYDQSQPAGSRWATHAAFDAGYVGTCNLIFYCVTTGRAYINCGSSYNELHVWDPVGDVMTHVPYTAMPGGAAAFRSFMGLAYV